MVGTSGDPGTLPLAFRQHDIPRDFAAVTRDVTTRIAPVFTRRNYAPLTAIPVLIASMARTTIVPSTPYQRQIRAPLKMGTQTGRY